MSSFTITEYLLILTVVFSLFQAPISAKKPHVINFRSPKLYPESLSWDTKAQHFIVGLLRHPTLQSVSDAGVVGTLVHDTSLPANSSILGITVDNVYRRLLVVVHPPSDPSNCALAAYDLTAPHRRLFLATLHDPTSSAAASAANDVAVDFSGNAFVTNSASNFIWKVDPEGKTSVLSRSPLFTRTPVEPDSPCGLKGVAYNGKGYLLVSQSNTGKLYKVDAEDGTARNVQLNKALTLPDGVALRGDGVLLVVSRHKLYFIRSDSSWSDGVVFDETDLDSDKFPTAVTVGADDRVYVLYGHVKEGMMGNSQSILEVRSEKESGDEAVLVYVLIGFGLAYFLFWRFQMRKLVSNMNKKIA